MCIKCDTMEAVFFVFSKKNYIYLLVRGVLNSESLLWVKNPDCKYRKILKAVIKKFSLIKDQIGLKYSDNALSQFRSLK